MGYEASEVARFWSKVRVLGPNDCWLWLGARLLKRGGYGQIRVKGRVLFAHRVSLELALGRPLVGWALHRCDATACVNPSHLYEGTPKQNAADAAGRIGKWDRRGTKNPAAKLTADNVTEIRRLLVGAPRGTKTLLARRFGVTRTAIHLIAVGHNWPDASN